MSVKAEAGAHITLRNLIAARWVLIALATASVLLAAFAGERLPVGLLPRSEHPVGVVSALAVWTLLNVASTVALKRERASELLAGAHLLVDALALTVLLALSGGPANPFTILYFLPITLATQVSPRWTWVLAGVCVACFAGLFLLSPADLAIEPTTTTTTTTEHQHHEHHHHPATSPTEAAGHTEHFEGHQLGMWVAFGIAGVLITLFVHRTALALARQRDELERLREAALEDRHLTALGTLAAGAAHELGTPLGTIKLLVDELPHLPDGESGEALTTIREQLNRCKLILSRMASPELRVSALGLAGSWPLVQLVDQLGGLDDIPLRIELDEPLASRSCSQPLEVFSQLLRELISNAADACRRTGEPERGVEVRFATRAERLIVEVVDRGVGMDEQALASAFSPFHTTRPESQGGMGLGLYLARAHLRQLGGTIELRSELGRGTTVRVELPFTPS